ncbi:MAG: hypothetical protein ABIG84_04805 [archaeon]
MGEDVLCSCTKPEGSLYEDALGFSPLVTIEQFIQIASILGDVKTDELDYKGNRFHFEMSKDKNRLLVSGKTYDEGLIREISKAVGYTPFVRYEETKVYVHNVIFRVTEWNKIDPEHRYVELEKLRKSELVRF